MIFYCLLRVLETSRKWSKICRRRQGSLVSRWTPIRPGCCSSIRRRADLACNLKIPGWRFSSAKLRKGIWDASLMLGRIMRQSYRTALQQAGRPLRHSNLSCVPNDVPLHSGRGFSILWSLYACFMVRELGRWLATWSIPYEKCREWCWELFLEDQDYWRKLGWST